MPSRPVATACSEVKPSHVHPHVLPPTPHNTQQPNHDYESISSTGLGVHSKEGVTVSEVLPSSGFYPTNNADVFYPPELVPDLDEGLQELAQLELSLIHI